MIVGELDLERAQRDPAYLARVQAFLVWPAAQEPEPATSPCPTRAPHYRQPRALAAPPALV